LKRSQLEPDDILFSIAGTIGESCLVKEEDIPANTNQAVAIIRGINLYCVPQFLLYELSSIIIDSLKEKARGGAMNNISLGDLRTAKVILPPLPEQHRIVAKLDSLFTRSRRAREALERVPGLCDRYKQAVLAAAFRGDLTADWRGKRKDITKWEIVKLGEVSTSRLGKMLDKSKNKGVPIPYLRNINVRWFEFDLTDIQEIKVTKDEIQTFSICRGDVLVCEGGEPGRCAIWQGSDHSYVYQKALHRIRVSKELTPEWLCYSLRDSADSSRLSELFTGTTIKHLTGVSLKQFKISLPSIAEQKEIIRRVEKLFKAIDSIAQDYQKARQLLDRLDQATLAKAFRGELVPQDPNDEPAAALLERIQAERQAEPKGKAVKSKQKRGK
jgi:type I restriction enzyme, S subunit